MWGDGDFCHKAIGLLKNVETHINSMGTPGNSNCRPSGGVGGGRGEGLDGTDQVGFGVGREGMSMPRGTPAGTGSRGGEGVAVLAERQHQYRFSELVRVRDNRIHAPPNRSSRRMGEPYCPCIQFDFRAQIINDFTSADVEPPVMDV